MAEWLTYPEVGERREGVTPMTTATEALRKLEAKFLDNDAFDELRLGARDVPLADLADWFLAKCDHDPAKITDVRIWFEEAGVWWFGYGQMTDYFDALTTRLRHAAGGPWMPGEERERAPRTAPATPRARLRDTCAGTLKILASICRNASLYGKAGD